MQNEYHADIIILGGSIGGCSAALAAAREGKQVILSEETSWIGGQLTNQGVPPDEHPWIEQFGCTQSYRTFRNKIRIIIKIIFQFVRNQDWMRLLIQGVQSLVTYLMNHVQHWQSFKKCWRHLYIRVN